MRIFITGKPGVGKTTLILAVVNELKERGYSVGGIITKEIREKGKRVGFMIRALDTGEEGILAMVGDGYPRIGRYAVNIPDLERIGVGAIKRAVRNAQIIVIDEIGSMEFKSREFKRAVEEAIDSGKPLLAVVHRRYVDKFRKFGGIYTLNYSNREQMMKEVLKFLLKSIERDTY